MSAAINGVPRAGRRRKNFVYTDLTDAERDRLIKLYNGFARLWNRYETHKDNKVTSAFLEHRATDPRVKIDPLSVSTRSIAFFVRREGHAHHYEFKLLRGTHWGEGFTRTLLEPDNIRSAHRVLWATRQGAH